MLHLPPGIFFGGKRSLFTNSIKSLRSPMSRIPRLAIIILRISRTHRCQVLDSSQIKQIPESLPKAWHWVPLRGNFYISEPGSESSASKHKDWASQILSSLSVTHVKNSSIESVFDLSVISDLITLKTERMRCVKGRIYWWGKLGGSKPAQNRDRSKDLRVLPG